MKRAGLLRAIAIGLVSSALLLVAALWLFQERLIYPAPHYGASELTELSPGLVALHDRGSERSTVGFYRSPQGNASLRRLWLVFGGNGELALGWGRLVSSSTRADQGYLLIEYPGYGARSGKPNPETLLAGTEVTLQTLADQLGTRARELEAHIAVLGYSLGAAAALSYAAHHRVERILLVSPFTSMLDMARRTVGWPLCYLLSHRYDNVAALRRIEQQGLPPLTILHGDSDEFIPPDMGRALAAQAPGSRFELVEGAHHGDVAELAAARLQELLAEP